MAKAKKISIPEGPDQVDGFIQALRQGGARPEVLAEIASKLQAQTAEQARGVVAASRPEGRGPGKAEGYAAELGRR